MNDLYAGTNYWRPDPAECASLLRYLLAEIPGGHVLWPCLQTLQVEARANGSDDVIVRTGQESQPLARVRMTWRGRPEIAPFFPETELFASDEDLRAALLKDMTK